MQLERYGCEIVTDGDADVSLPPSETSMMMIREYEEALPWQNAEGYVVDRKWSEPPRRQEYFEKNRILIYERTPSRHAERNIDMLCSFGREVAMLPRFLERRGGFRSVVRPMALA